MEDILYSFITIVLYIVCIITNIVPSFFCCSYINRSFYSELCRFTILEIRMEQKRVEQEMEQRRLEKEMEQKRFEQERED